jgi:DNA-binding LytR/AlgR family response regulator
VKIIIIEDERPASEKLKKALLHHDTSIQLEAVLNSTRSAIQWFRQNPLPDLIFMDIELSDGLSFEIFKSCDIHCPVIFTTAYNEYWQEAFEHNSIDYLLKPIRQEKLESALNKYKKLQQHFSINYAAFFRQTAAGQPNGYPKRLLIKKGTDLIALKTEEIAYCYAAHKMAFMVDDKGQKFITDKSLFDLEKELDPTMFFRANRKYLVNVHHISRIKTIAKSKLSLELNPPVNEEVIISHENSASFKQWVGGS